MKKRLFALTLILFVLASLLTVAAEGETEGNFGENDALHWSYADNTLSITGTGAIPDYASAAEQPWAAWSAETTAVTIAQGVSAIGTNAFEGMNLTSVTAPCTLTGLPAATTTTPVHTLTEVARVEPSYTTAGTAAHWVCTACNKLFTDNTATTETTAEALILPRTDTEAPVLVSAVVNPQSVTAPGSAVVTVAAIDNLSGISGGSVTFTNMTSGTQIASTLSVINNSALSGTLSFTAGMTTGDYYISSLTLTDNAANSMTYTTSNFNTELRSVKVNLKSSSSASTSSTIGTLTMNASSVGYGGVVTGTVLLKDANGNPIPYANLDVYVGGTRSSITATTDANGQATFNYSNTIPGTYTLKAVYAGNGYYYACETNTVNVTFTNVPSTGDEYDVMLWVFVGLMALSVNAWFVWNKKKAYR